METDNLKIDCPCKRKKCERYGDCAACREHHAGEKFLTACDRLLAKREKKNKRKTP